MKSLGQKLGYQFKDQQLVDQACRHRSALHDKGQELMGSNERLEYLGDAVIDLVVGRMLFQKFSADDEGDLSRKRASLVNTAELAGVCTKLELQEHLIVGKSEETQNLSDRPRVLASLYEALVGAMFLEAGFDEAARLVEIHLGHLLEGRDSISDFDSDHKTRFQEKVQKDRKLTPTYKLLNEDGPEHQKVFTVGVYILEELIQMGQGKTKKSAEQEAAKRALEKWNV